MPICPICRQEATVPGHNLCVECLIDHDNGAYSTMLHGKHNRKADAGDAVERTDKEHCSHIVDANVHYDDDHIVDGGAVIPASQASKYNLRSVLRQMEDDAERREADMWR